MIDKVQKIREEAERLYNQSLADENRQADRGLERAANVSYGKSKACKEILSFIDSLQEDLNISPVFDEGYWERLGEESVSDIDFEQELYKAFGQVKDFTLGMQIAKWFYDMGRNSQEPVSEDLHQASIAYADANSEYVTNGNGRLVEHYNIRAKEHFISGANWQKQQIMKDAVDACVTDIRTYKEENEIDFTVMYEKGIIPYEIEQEVKLIIIKED